MRRPAAAEPLVRERAPAKLNLDLHVTGRRADGYHLLDSLVVFLDLADELTLTPAASLDLRAQGPMAGDLPAGQGNIVLRAARALARATSVTDGAAITLDKRLPVAAGIGGGSADAAAALRGLCRLWGVRPEPEALAELALGLGADVPACLDGRPLRMCGVGERLDPLADLPPLDLVLVNPRRPLATADVFRTLALPQGGLEEPPAALDLAPLDRLPRSRNDLEAPAQARLPEIGRVLAALGETPGCRLARMSGSGPTCFGLFADAPAAQAAALELARRQPGWWVVASRSQGAP
jgi:4-diphosphocytidyl-2-C-methyl-D-erythritol kinase